MIIWVGLCLCVAVAELFVVQTPGTVLASAYELWHNGLEYTNDRPIIGVLAQELTPRVRAAYPQYSSYIAASYVKYLEGAGARVVPIQIKQDKSYYKNLVKSINGVLLPGGAAWFNVTGGYAEAGSLLYQYATELNARRDHFPVWGTCLGFELLAYLAAGQHELRSPCSAENLPLPLHLKPDYFDGRLFRGVPPDVVEILTSQAVTANFHSLCVTEETMARRGLDREWHVSSTNLDDHGTEFVSSFESRRLPFFGVQFHPEKNGYEFKPTKNIPHSSAAIHVMQYFANFFVDQARQSRHKFPNASEEQEALIYNYQPVYTQDRLSFEQCYFFK